MGSGFAVIDIETTGLFPAQHDRIVEIGIVHLTSTGEVEGKYGTLVNPGRDMGAQRIHGITAAMASRAPTFEAIAPRILSLLSGRVPVAHNASFDAGFLDHQLSAVGLQAVPTERWMCTMKIAQSVLPNVGRSLRDCCTSIGVTARDAHHALADAEVTAQLLQAYMRLVPDKTWWGQWLASALTLKSELTPPVVEWMSREVGALAPPTLLERVSVKVEQDDGGLNLDYLALLDRILLDRVMSVTEADSLVAIATKLGLARTAIERMHKAYFAGLVSAAWADGVVTAEEEQDIRAVGKALSIPDEQINDAVETASGETTHQMTAGFRLRPGDKVVITGEMSISREQWYERLEQHGLVPGDSIVKAAKLLASADPDSMSGKARKAREYGIPIVNETGLERLLKEM